MLKSLLCAALSLTATGCASIVSKSSWSVTVDSNPPGADLVVKNKEGQTMQRGTAPLTLTLDSGDGYFGRGRYTVEAAFPGYESACSELGAEFNGWYVGNLLFGGLIGFLIVDPLTGAMWRFDEREVVTLAAVKT